MREYQIQLEYEITQFKMKEFDHVQKQLQKYIVFFHDLHGGLIKLGWVCSPNNLTNIHNFELWVDNLLIYGSGYIKYFGNSFVESAEFDIDFFQAGHKTHLLKALRLLCEISEVGK